jgi:hypothetical protein
MNGTHTTQRAFRENRHRHMNVADGKGDGRIAGKKNELEWDALCA